MGGETKKKGKCVKVEKGQLMCSPLNLYLATHLGKVPY